MARSPLTGGTPAAGKERKSISRQGRKCPPADVPADVGPRSNSTRPDFFSTIRSGPFEALVRFEKVNSVEDFP